MKQKSNTTKVKLPTIFPTTPYFTIQDFLKLNSPGVEITLRTKLAAAIANGSIAEIGAVPGGHGRPPKVFSMTPVTQTTLNKAKQDKINLIDNANRLINIVNVTPRSPSTITPSVNTPSSVIA